MEQAGVTREIAEEWREFYKFIKTNFPSNPSAGGRFDLMQKVVELLGGK